MLLGILILGALAWFDNHSRQAAYAREAADTYGDADDIAATTDRMREAAERADEILREFRARTGDDA